MCGEFAESFLPRWCSPFVFLGIPHPPGKSILGSHLSDSEMKEVRQSFLLIEITFAGYSLCLLDSTGNITQQRYSLFPVLAYFGI